MLLFTENHVKELFENTKGPRNESVNRNFLFLCLSVCLPLSLSLSLSLSRYEHTNTGTIIFFNISVRVSSKRELLRAKTTKYFQC